MKGSMMVVTILTEAKKLGYVIVVFFLSQIKKLYKPEERFAALHLIDMINSVEAEGMKLREDFPKDIFKELVKKPI